MAENRGGNWRAILWALAKPALVAGIVALLVALGVTGLRAPYSGDLGAQANTTFSGPLLIGGGIRAGNNITLTAGALINTQGAVTVTDSLRVTGASTFVQPITGAGIDNVGTLTQTGAMSVTSWLRSMGQAWDIGATLAITADGAITPGKTIHLVTDTGGQASGTVTLNSTTSIVSGSYVGQLLIVLSAETHGATMTIKDGANCQLPSNSDLALGLADSAWFLWDGTDWICIGATNN